MYSSLLTCDVSPALSVCVCFTAFMILGVVLSLHIYIQSSTILGWISVLGAIIVFGSYPIHMKGRKITQIDLNPIIFQVYFSIGTALTGLIVVPIVTHSSSKFSMYGLIGGALWTLLELSCFVAIKTVGLALAPAIWSGITCIISFAWGALCFNENISHPVYAMLSLLILVIGILVVAFSQFIGTQLSHYIVGNGYSSDSALQSQPLLEETNCNSTSKTNLIFGISLSIINGVINGSLMVPFQASPTHTSPLQYTGSFSIGIIISLPCFAIVWWTITSIINKRRIHMQWYIREAAWRGVLTGFLWAVANICSIYATKYLGQTLGFPLTQIACAVNGLWGIVFFRELRGAPVFVFFGAVTLILCASAGLTLATT